MIKEKNPYVSVIIPCWNEEKFIGKCLTSIISQDYPKSNIEILIVDGMSNDMTKDIIKQYSGQYAFIKLLENPKKIVPTGLNIGIREARGEIIIRLDAHCVYGKDYISKCVKYLLKYNVDNVGGLCITLPGSNTNIAESIALAISHPFGVGNSYFRIGTKNPRYVDTVPFGCYRREVFNKIGLFDEDLVRNQDDELNLRLIRHGGKILLIPDIVSYYYARDTLSKLWKMYYQYGYFKPVVAKKIGAILTFRQIIPVAFVVGLITFGLFSLIWNPFLWFFLLVSSIYLITDMFFSLIIGVKKGLKYFLVLPLVFAIIHFSYGFGYIKGIWDFIFFKKIKKTLKNLSLQRKSEHRS